MCPRWATFCEYDPLSRQCRMYMKYATQDPPLCPPPELRQPEAFAEICRPMNNRTEVPDCAQDELDEDVCENSFLRRSGVYGGETKTFFQSCEVLPKSRLCVPVVRSALDELTHVGIDGRCRSEERDASKEECESHFYGKICVPGPDSVCAQAGYGDEFVYHLCEHNTMADGTTKCQAAEDFFDVATYHVLEECNEFCTSPNYPKTLVDIAKNDNRFGITECSGLTQENCEASYYGFVPPTAATGEVEDFPCTLVDVEGQILPECELANEGCKMLPFDCIPLATTSSLSATDDISLGAVIAEEIVDLSDAGKCADVVDFTTDLF